VWYRLFPRQRSVNLVVTNAPGPPVPLYLAGARLLELFPMMPVMGNLTLVVGVLSYAGQLNLTAVADRDSCPDLGVFAQGMRSAFDDLARSVPVPAPRAARQSDVLGAARPVASGAGHPPFDPLTVRSPHYGEGPATDTDPVSSMNKG
jgi:hypothetical protein